MLGFRASFLALAALFALSGAASEQQPPAGKIFRFRLPFEPATLDWNRGDVPIWVTQNTMRGLYRVDENGAVVADLVESAKTKEGGKTWVFRLKSEIHWSDGIPLRAAHAAASLSRLLHPQTASSYASFLFDLVGAKEYHRDGRGGLGIRVTGDLTFELRLDRPVPYLPAILTHWVTYPVRPDLIMKWKDHWENPAHMAALGAYRVTEFVRATRVVLTPNPKAAEKPWFERVEAWVIPDDNTALNLYQAGHLELMTDPGPAAAKHPHLRHQPSPIVYFVGVGPGHPLTSSRAGVLALSAALNREELPKALGAPHRPTLEYCPPEIWEPLGGPPSAKDSAVPASGSPELAKRFLKEAGFESVRRVPPLTLKFFNRPAIRDLAEWLQEQWKKNLGLHVTLEGYDVKSYWSMLATEPAALFINSKGASYPDPDAFFRLFVSSNEQNLGRWKNEEYDKTVEQAGTTEKSSARRDLYARASQRLLAESPGMIPLYFRSTEILVKPTVKNLVINPLTSVDFSRASYR